MTANAMASDRAACLAAGMNDHVGKPFELDHLVTMLLACTGRGTQQAQARAPEPVAEPAPPAALDLSAALERMGGNATILASALNAFAAELRQSPAHVAQHLAQGVASDGARALHTLKGLAATLGAGDLAQRLAQLESRLREDAPASEQAAWVDELQRLADAGAAVLAPALQQYPLADDTAKANTQPLDDERLATDLQALCQLLQAADMGALTHYQALRQTHGGALPQALAPLDTAMASLDFVTALRLCQVWLEERAR
jgi:HPt (histidine-containing phosphotransfer) domain-containing protein